MREGKRDRRRRVCLSMRQRFECARACLWVCSRVIDVAS